MIKPCWGYLKRLIIKKGLFISYAAAEKAWLEAWRDLE